MMKILVVDDVGYSRHYHSRLLQKFGYQTEAVEGGPQALKVLERDMTISVVLTDMMMREMDGVELFKQSLRINRLIDGRNAEPPAFVLMTALRPGKGQTQQKDHEKVRMARDIGFVDVLFKPVEPDQLKLTLETIKSARSEIPIDTAGALRKVSETIQQLIAANRADEAGQFLDELRCAIEKLDSFVAQPA